MNLKASTFRYPKDPTSHAVQLTRFPYSRGAPRISSAVRETSEARSGSQSGSSSLPRSGHIGVLQAELDKRKRRLSTSVGAVAARHQPCLVGNTATLQSTPQHSAPTVPAPASTPSPTPPPLPSCSVSISQCEVDAAERAKIVDAEERALLDTPARSTRSKSDKGKDKASAHPSRNCSTSDDPPHHRRAAKRAVPLHRRNAAKIGIRSPTRGQRKSWIRRERT